MAVTLARLRSVLTPGAMLVRLLVALAVAVLIVSFIAYSARGFVPGDAFTYLAAGERLNAGHQLYALQPGDRPVDLHPPFWVVPLLSPPFIAVIWRPLAALPAELGVYLWWIGAIASICGVLAWLLVRRPVVAALAILLLDVPITFELGVGNVNGYLLLGTVATWLLIRRGHDRLGGAVVATMAAIKIWPAILAVWFVAQRRWGAVAAFAAAGAVCLLVSVLGAGLDAHVQYLDIARQTGTTGLSDGSLAGIATMLGAPDGVARLLPYLAAAGGAGAILAFRRHPGATYALAVATMLFASPVVNINGYSLLLGMLVPLAAPAAGSPRGEAAVSRVDIPARHGTTSRMTS